MEFKIEYDWANRVYKFVVYEAVKHKKRRIKLDYDKDIALNIGVDEDEYKRVMFEEYNAELNFRKQIRFVERKDAKRALKDYIEPRAVMRILVNS